MGAVFRVSILAMGMVVGLGGCANPWREHAMTEAQIVARGWAPRTLAQPEMPPVYCYSTLVSPRPRPRQRRRVAGSGPDIRRELAVGIAGCRRADISQPNGEADRDDFRVVGPGGSWLSMK